MITLPPKKHILLALLLGFSATVRADISLPALIGDNMVLQRDAEVPVWGWADVGEGISVRFQGKTWQTTAGNQGKWQVMLPPMPAGGPYEMTISGNNSITLHHIMLGEVWLASGQSNMRMRLEEIQDARKEIASAQYPEIRLFTVDQQMAFQPRKTITSSGWQPCWPESAESFSAVAYLFARELYEHLHVPIGIINTTWGGTTAQTWTSAEGLKPLADFADEVETISGLTEEDFQRYLVEKQAWADGPGAVDRGRNANALNWDDPDLDDSEWATMPQPALWFDYEELKRFGGTIWFRKEIDIPPHTAGKPIELGLANIIEQDSTFFNGAFIGTNTGYFPTRLYTVPGELVQSGRNVIAVRMTGRSEFGGFLGDPANLFVRYGSQQVSLADDWRYQTGPDLESMPHLAGLKTFSQALPSSATLLFNGMIAPLLPYSIKGVIWYQGESNADNRREVQQYYRLFPALIDDWRKHWGHDFPFLFVQLAGFQSDANQPADPRWARIREAQANALGLPNTGMAVAIDIGNEHDIHPINKQDVALRLAAAAFHVAYQENVEPGGPAYRSMKIEGNQIRLSFDQVGYGLWAKDPYGYLKGFAIAGVNQKFVWAKAWIEGNEVVVSASEVPNPVAVRYNWGNTPDGNLYSQDGLPAVPFRTDDWDWEEE